MSHEKKYITIENLIKTNVYKSFKMKSKNEFRRILKQGGVSIFCDYINRWEVIDPNDVIDITEPRTMRIGKYRFLTINFNEK